MDTIMNWLTNRFKERTSFDGIAIIGVSLVALFVPIICQTNF